MYGLAAAAVLAAHSCEMALVQKAQSGMTPEGFKAWQAERTAERRHQQTVAAIRQAGENARPRGIGLFW